MFPCLFLEYYCKIQFSLFIYQHIFCTTLVRRDPVRANEYLIRTFSSRTPEYADVLSVLKIPCSPRLSP